MSKYDSNMIPLDSADEVAASCEANCKIYNKATVSYEYIIDNEASTNTAESSIVSTCIEKRPINSFKVFKVASQRYVKPGDIVDFTIVISNTGNTILKDIKISDILNENLLYVGSPNLYVNNNYVSPIFTESKLPSIELAIPTESTLLPEQSAVFTFKVKIKDSVTSGTLISNTAVVSSNDSNGNAITPENTNTVELEVKFVQLVVTKSAPETIRCGDPLTYTIVVENKSKTDSATNVIVTDYFAPEFVFTLDNITVPNGASKSLESSNGINVSIPTIPANGSVTITVPGTINCCCPS